MSHINWDQMQTQAMRTQIRDDAAKAAGCTEALAYLAGTDWYLVRQLETGTAIPDDVLKKRARARATASDIGDQLRA